MLPKFDCYFLFLFSSVIYSSGMVKTVQRNHDEYTKSDIEMYSHSEMNEWKKYVSLVYVDKMSYKTRSIQLLLLHKYTGLFSLCVTNKFASIVNFPLRNWAISSSTSTAFSEGYSRSCCCSIPFRYLHVWKVTNASLLCYRSISFLIWNSKAFKSKLL